MTVAVAQAPMMNWPSPPRLKTPHLYAKTAASDVKMSGHARSSVLPSLLASPRAPEIMAP